MEQVLNGLYSPTSAERFFEQGRQQLDVELQRLNKPEKEETEILKIDEEILQQKPISSLGMQEFNLPESPNREDRLIN